MHPKYILPLLLVLAASAHAAGPPEFVVRMTDAAQKFIASLDDGQRKIALKPMNDAEREAFKPVPFPIVGLRFDAMQREQIALLHELLKTGLSPAAYHKLTEIIRVDDVLLQTEQGRGRSPAFHGSRNYNIVIFDTPTPGGTWSWRFHGHHIYLSFTIVKGELFATAPAFFGAEPNDVSEGPGAPWRVLANEEDLGVNLYNTLDAGQKATATIATAMPDDLVSGRASKVDPMAPAGIAWAKLTKEQQAGLQALVLEYCNNSADDLRFERLKRVEDGGWENLYFAWIGDPARLQRKYYRVQGPRFLIEYCAVSLSPNHIHSVWRDFNGDYGRDILAEHLASNPH
jgi:hypothetical protein